MSTGSSGTGTVYKRRGSPYYWIDYTHDGERYRESSKSSKKSVAIALLKQRLAECETQGKPMRGEETVTLGDLRDAHRADFEANGRRSWWRCEDAWGHVLDYLNESRPALRVSGTALDEYVAHRLGEGAARATVNKELSALRRGYSLLTQRGELSRAPHIKTLRTDNVRTGFLTREQVDAICAEIGPDLAPLVRFAFLTGWRKGEVLGLTWDRVDFAAGTVRLEPGSTKNRDGRTFPFAALPALRTVLREQWRRTQLQQRTFGLITRHVFHRHGAPIRSFRRAWRAACEAAEGVPDDAIFHDLRRSAVRELVRAGVPEQVAMKLTGHRTRSIFDRYAIVDEALLREGVEKLAAHRAAS